MYDEATRRRTAHAEPRPFVYVGRPATVATGGALQDIAPTMLASWACRSLRDDRTVARRAGPPRVGLRKQPVGGERAPGPSGSRRDGAPSGARRCVPPRTAGRRPRAGFDGPAGVTSPAIPGRSPHGTRRGAGGGDAHFERRRGDRKNRAPGRWKRQGWSASAPSWAFCCPQFLRRSRSARRRPRSRTRTWLLSAVFGRIKSDYVETVPDDKLIKGRRSTAWCGAPTPLGLPGLPGLQGAPESRPRRFGGLGIEIGVEPRGVRRRRRSRTPRVPRRHQVGRPHRQDRRHRDARPAAVEAVEKMRSKPGTQVVLTVVRKDVDQLLTFTLTREEINVKSVRARCSSRATATSASAISRSAPGEDPRRRSRSSTRQGRAEGPRARRAQRPGRPPQPEAVAVSAAFLPEGRARRTPTGRTPDARMRLLATKGELLAARRRPFPGPAGGRKKVPMVVLVDGTRVGVERSWRARFAGSQARHRDRQPDVRQGLGPDDPAAQQQRRPRSSRPRYYTPSGRSIRAKGIEPDIAVDDGTRQPIASARPTSSGISDDQRAALPRRIPAGPAHEGRGGARQVDAPVNKSEAAAALPRSSRRERRLPARQAMNHLKGMPVIASTKAVAASGVRRRSSPLEEV